MVSMCRTLLTVTVRSIYLSYRFNAVAGAELVLMLPLSPFGKNPPSVAPTFIPYAR